MSRNPNAYHGAEALSHQVRAGVLPIEHPKPREKRPSRLSRGTGLKRGSSKLKVTPLGHCTEEQKARVRGRACIVDAAHGHECHPAHVIDRAAVSVEMADDVRAVVPLCAFCHRDYDDGDLDLSPFLEPHWRDAVACAVEAVGLFRALRRITGRRWAPGELETSTEGEQP